MEELTLNLEKKKYRCTKGHTWEGSFVGGPGQSFYFSLPTGEQRQIKGLCLICLLDRAEELLKDVGRVEVIS